VAAALWDNSGVQDLACFPIQGVGFENLGSDDTFDDMPIPDYSLIGSDGAPAVLNLRSHVKRDQRVRTAVLDRAKGKCERAQCNAARNYPGFLDVHHILGAEKSDRVWNCIALCPNCHREAHYAPDREKINGDLLVMAKGFYG
jgi:5-methylcytosine-specific restriction protein A